MSENESNNVEEKPVVSISQLNMLNKCGEQYRRRYVLGEKIPPAFVMVVGSAVDGGVNANMRNKKEVDLLLPEEQIVDITVDTFKKKIAEEGVKLDDDEVHLGLKKAQGMYQDRSTSLAKLHYSKFAPIIKPTHIQRKMRVILKDYPRDLTGYIDIQEGRESVRDTKTKGKSMNQSDADSDDQLTMYAMFVKAVDGFIPKKLCFDVLVATKTKFKDQAIVTKRTEDDFRPVLARIENFIITLEKGSFVPCPESFWGCSKKYCGYWPTCRYVKRPRSVSVL